MGHGQNSAHLKNRRALEKAKKQSFSAVRADEFEKPLALAGGATHNFVMEATILEAQKLRPAIIQRIEAMDDESLLLLHRLLLYVEKERLWHELSVECEADRRSGKLDRLPDIIREARVDLRKG
jgi:hypothetical protein